MNFGVAGPFDITRHGSKDLITKQSKTDLKQVLDKVDIRLSQACGCYIFALRAGTGYTPYYIGQSCKNSLTEEAFNPSNMGKYNDIIAESKGTPIIFLIPLLTPKGKFRKQTSRNRKLPSVDFLERWLIGEALKKNENLKNNKETMFLKNIHVIGIFNARHGEATSDSRELKRVLY